MKPVRCAIYTRKSSEEGLDQAFNSLDAQREACAAYILSQASEGWVALPDIYDDGGLSGGTLDRPALQRLLSEVKAGRIDTIVVYKVDRLTRSLLDFSKLVEAFDAAGTSFVSVTQSFNTTTSMGRLTLNMLLSFAQFEREVTAERIRDKIAASKAKGMWMGGIPPVGYEPDGRSLKIVDEHADLVRRVFELYLELGNVRLVTERLCKGGVRSPTRIKAKTGATYGGVPFSRGQIYGILKCPTYVGEVHHNGKVFPGLHEAIIDRDIWDRTQAMLAGNLQGHRRGERVERPSLLAGKIVDEAGEPLLATHACKGKTRYRYYVSRALQDGSAASGMRVPAGELEAVVILRLSRLFADPLQLLAEASLTIAAPDLETASRRGLEIASRLEHKDRELIMELVDKVIVTATRVDIACHTRTIAKLLQLEEPDEVAVTFSCDVRVTRTGGVVRMVDTGGKPAISKIDLTLVKLIAKAHRWWGDLRKGEMNVSAYAQSQGVNEAWLTRVLRLAFLSPDLIDAILRGQQGAMINAKALLSTGAIDRSWAVQRRTLVAPVNQLMVSDP